MGTSTPRLPESRDSGNWLLMLVSRSQHSKLWWDGYGECCGVCSETLIWWELADWKDGEDWDGFASLGYGDDDAS